MVSRLISVKYMPFDRSESSLIHKCFYNSYSTSLQGNGNLYMKNAKNARF